MMITKQAIIEVIRGAQGGATIGTIGVVVSIITKGL